MFLYNTCTSDKSQSIKIKNKKGQEKESNCLKRTIQFWASTYFLFKNWVRLGKITPIYYVLHFGLMSDLWKLLLNKILCCFCLIISLCAYLSLSCWSGCFLYFFAFLLVILSTLYCICCTSCIFFSFCIYYCFWSEWFLKNILCTYIILDFHCLQQKILVWDPKYTRVVCKTQQNHI